MCASGDQRGHGRVIYAYLSTYVNPGREEPLPLAFRWQRHIQGLLPIPRSTIFLNYHTLFTKALYSINIIFFKSYFNRIVPQYE